MYVFLAWRNGAASDCKRNGYGFDRGWLYFCFLILVDKARPWGPPLMKCLNTELPLLALYIGKKNIIKYYGIVLLSQKFRQTETDCSTQFCLLKLGNSIFIESFSASVHFPRTLRAVFINRSQLRDRSWKWSWHAVLIVSKLKDHLKIDLRA